MRSRTVILAILAAMFDLSKRVVVLTGATGTIGPTVLRAYLEQRAHVAIPVRDEAKGNALRDSLGDLAGVPDDPRLLLRAADPGDRTAMDGFVEEVLRAWGRLDAVANLIGGVAPPVASGGGPAAARLALGHEGAAGVAPAPASAPPSRAPGPRRGADGAPLPRPARG